MNRLLSVYVSVNGRCGVLLLSLPACLVGDALLGGLYKPGRWEGRRGHDDRALKPMGH